MIQIADMLEQQRIAGWIDGQTGARITWQAIGISELFTEFCRDEQHTLNVLRSLDRCDRSTVVSVEFVPLTIFNCGGYMWAWLSMRPAVSS